MKIGLYICFALFFNFWLLCCWDDVLIDFCLIFDGFRGRNPSKIGKKSIKKAIKNKMQVGIDFGWLLERFWAQVGGQNGAKLAPKSEKWRSQDDVTK